MPVLHHPDAVDHLAILENTEKKHSHFIFKYPSFSFQFLQTAQLVFANSKSVISRGWPMMESEESGWGEKNGTYSILSHITLMLCAARVILAG